MCHIGTYASEFVCMWYMYLYMYMCPFFRVGTNAIIVRSVRRAMTCAINATVKEKERSTRSSMVWTTTSPWRGTLTWHLETSFHMKELRLASETHFGMTTKLTSAHGH